MEPCHRAEQYQIGTNSSHKFLFTFHWILLCTVLGPVACWQPLMTCFSTLITASKNWSHHQQNSTVDAHLWIGFILLMLCWHDFFGWVSGADLTSRHRFTAVHNVYSPSVSVEEVWPDPAEFQVREMQTIPHFNFCSTLLDWSLTFQFPEHY